MNQTRERAHH